MSLDNHSRRNDTTRIQGIIFNPYSIQDLHLGVAVHEYGHALGLRDLYEPPSPFGYYDVMASADRADNPGHFSAYSKILLGWIDPLVVDAPVTGLQIPNSHDHPFAVIIYGRSEKECCYFVIENRLQKGYDSGGPGTISSSGLLVYHIHKNSAAWSHLEQADGLCNLEAYYSEWDGNGNFGDAGDFFPGTTHNTQFTSDTNPSSRLRSGDETGVSITGISAQGDVMTIDVSLSVSTGSEIERIDSDRFILHPSYPNPFSESTTIQYDLPRPADVTLTIFNSLGGEVATLESGFKPAGSHHIRFEARSLPQGAYFCRLRVGVQSATRKLLILR